jgi:flavorubredoxin
MVVYESMYGNTQRVAEAIGDGLRSNFEVEVREVSNAARHVDGVDLLIVGGPIHAWSMTRPSTRKDVREHVGDAAIVSSGIGIREFLDRLHEANRAQPQLAATFDTAIRTRWFPTGSAAKPAAKQLAHHGYRLIAEPQHFYVEDQRGPLVEGELERARAWGAQLAKAA